MQFRDRARAKVNLTLRVLGKRPDGYHALESLVAFAEVGDELLMDLAQSRGVAVTGPFAAALAGADNMVARAVDAVVAHHPAVRVGHVTLDKHLPVAAGIGGGSADAAAVLRLIQAANPAIQAVSLMEIAARLGADVPVCLMNRPAVMTGTGTDVAELATFPAINAVLVNPLAPVPGNKTAAVFSQLAAGPLAQGAGRPAEVLARTWDRCDTAADLIAAIAAEANDLEAAATAVMPVVGDVLAALRMLGGQRLARLSGAGPTCFALFDTPKDAARAADDLRRAHPTWWVAATTLEGLPA